MESSEDRSFARFDHEANVLVAVVSRLLIASSIREILISIQSSRSSALEEDEDELDLDLLEDLDDDFFLDEVKHENEANKLRLHPGYAVKNASKYIDLTEKQIDIISTHMFPVTFTPPKYIESWIVDLLDDVAALYEKGYGIHRELRTSIYLLMLLVVNFVKIR